MHALEWIDEHGRYLRTIGADRLRRVLGRRAGECTWCGAAVPKGGRRRRYCSEACHEATLWRTAPAALCYRMERGDLRCAKCGRDVKWILRFVAKCKAAWQESSGPRWAGDDWRIAWTSHGVNWRGRRNQRRTERLARLWRPIGGALADYRRRNGLIGLRPWEWDHIVPVSEGGGLCGVEGYRCLCLPCHKQETAALRRRTAERRRRDGGRTEADTVGTEATTGAVGLGARAG